MAAVAGRSLIVRRAGVVVAGVKSKTVTLNGEAIDITNDDDLGGRALLDDVAGQGVELAAEGVVKSDIFRAAYFAGTFIDDMEIEYPDGAIIAGDFHMANYEETGPTEDALTFSCTFQSTGVVTYTAAP